MSQEATPAAHGADGQKIKIAIDPVTRVEGHLKIEVEVKDGKVVDAKCYGGMYRGFEQILKGRDPRDSSQIVQRICGVCPTAHCTASVMAQDEAFKVKVPSNGRMIRNLTLGANYLQSHILHFYHLAALDYVKGPDVSPFVPRYENADLLTDRIKDKAKAEATNTYGLNQYLKALEMRRICHEMVAMFGGRMPHVQGFVVGGATQIPTAEKLAEFAARFKEVKKFVEEEYLPLVYTVGSVYLDLFETGSGWKNVIAYGVFPQDDEGTAFLFKPGVYIDGKDEAVDPKQIKEFVGHSYFDQSVPGGLHYSVGETNPNPDKKDAYSFVKAPRYKGKPCEVGPLARMWVDNPDLSPVGVKLLKSLYGIEAKKFRDLGDKAFSIMGRHVARAEETYLTAIAIEGWLKDIKPGAETYEKSEIPSIGEGTGFTEAPRGALLHYLKVKDKKIDNYQIISATLWNCCPSDEMGQRGPVEQALIGVPVPDIKNPVNIGRLIRAYDP